MSAMARRQEVPFKEVVNSNLRRGLSAGDAPELCSRDNDFDRFSGVRWIDPLA
jgi:hypothetical protein